ncbi:MAG: hypothetical protein QOD99_186, partial [Chthoniobacter sp.]|nr:hypothetical protein [Chthoniobacter sp.]
MNEFQDRLGRLLKLAAQAPRDVPPELPFGFDTRVLAHWRSAREDNSGKRLAVFRWALSCSLVLMLGSLAFSYKTLTTPVSTEFVVANSAIE